MTVGHPGLEPLEIASGLVAGNDPPAHMPRQRPEASPLDALEAAIRPALERSPCVVSFSGGRDSSAVLAVAVRLARREGLPLPVPVTNRFPAVETADESEWQEQVVRELDLNEWVRLEHEDELDCIGPIAADKLRRHGLLWPFNAHFLVPLLEAARGGSILTGLGGDELLGETRWARAATVLAGRERPTLRDGRRIALALAPRRLRRPVLRSRVEVDLFWLRPGAVAQIRQAWIDDDANEPFRWAARIGWSAARAYLRVGEASLRILAEDENVRIAHPLHDPGFVEAVAALPPSRRFFDRTAAMRTLFGDLLPDEILSRRSKSSFDEAFFNRHSRAFVAEWDGSGIDDSLVDADQLRSVWQSPRPDARSFLLLQSAWLAQAGPVRESTHGAVQEQVGALS